MAKQHTQGEKTRLALQEKAKAELLARHGEYVVDWIFSWMGTDLIVDAKVEPAGWIRFAYIPDDDTELAGVRELA